MEYRSFPSTPFNAPHLFLRVLLSLLGQILRLAALLLQHLRDLANSLLDDLLRIVTVLLSDLLQLRQLGDNLVTTRNLVEVLIQATEAGLLGLARRALDVRLKIPSVARLNSRLDLVVQLLNVARLERVGILLHELLDLGVLLQVRLRLLHALLVRLVAELLHLLDLLLDDLLNLGHVLSAQSCLDDVTDLLPCPVCLLLGLRAILVAVLLQLVDVASDLLLQLRVVIHDLLGGVASEVADAAEVLDDDVPRALGCQDGDVAVLGDVLKLAICLANDLVHLIAVLRPDVIEVLECGVDVATCAWDEDGVALRSATEHVEGLVGFGSRLLELVLSSSDVVFGGLGRGEEIPRTGLAVPDISNGEGS